MAEATITTTSFNPAKLSKTSLEIISFIYENGGATTTEIANKIGKPKNYLTRYIYNLKRLGLISKILKTWTLTKSGMSVLELISKEKLKRNHLIPNEEEVEYIINNFNNPEVERVKCAVCGKVPLGVVKPTLSMLEKYIKFFYPEYADKFVTANLIKHHVSYKDNETVLVCSKCHQEIHHNKNNPFYPRDQRVKETN